MDSYEESMFGDREESEEIIIEHDMFEQEETQTDYSTELLIDLIEQNRPLWDIYQSDYKKLPLKVKLYSEIGSILGGIEGSEVQKRWTNIRDRFVKECKEKPLSGSGGSKRKKPWCHLERLQFLRTTLRKNKTHTNVSNIEQACQQPPLFKRPETKTSDSASSANTSSASTSESHEDTWEPSQSRKKARTSALEAAILKELSTPEVKEPLDPDNAFFMSLVPAFKRLNQKSQARLKIDIAQLFFDTEFAE